MKNYKIKFKFEDVDGFLIETQSIFSVKSEKDLKKQVEARKNYGEEEKTEQYMYAKVSEYSGGWNDIVEVEEVSSEELLKEEVKKLKNNLFQIFARNIFNKTSLSITEAEMEAIRDKYINTTDGQYEMLVYLNKLVDIEKYMCRWSKPLRKTLEGISAKKWLDMVDQHCLPKTIAQLKGALK